MNENPQAPDNVETALGYWSCALFAAFGAITYHFVGWSVLGGVAFLILGGCYYLWRGDDAS